MNALSLIVAIDLFRPLMKEDGVVVAVMFLTSSIANNTDGGWEVYRASKALQHPAAQLCSARNSDDRKTYLALDPAG